MSEKKEGRKDAGPSDEQLDKLIDDSIKGEKKQEKEKPKAAEKAKPAPMAMPVTGYDPWNILKYPNLAEKAMNMVEIDNKLVFTVIKNANKPMIKEAVEKGFNVKVRKVNVEITQKGQKRAYVKLDPKDSAADIASRLGML